MPVPIAPLVDAAHVRVPFLLAHAVAYALGAAMLFGTLQSTPSPAWALVGFYLSVVVVSLIALRLGKAPLGSFLVIDAIAVPSIPLMTGQHPASVHVTMLVLVLAAAAMTRFRVVVIIGIIELVGFTFGLTTRNGPPLTTMPADQIDRSEVGGMVIGAMVGVIAIVVLSRLLRESLRSQAEALEAQRRTNALQQRFVSMVSHELRTPLTSIRGFAEVLADDGDRLTDLEREEFTHAIADQSTHLSRLVDDVLVVVRIDAAKLSVHSEAVDLSQVVETATAMVVTPQSKRILIGPLPPTPVLADVDRLVQVIRNLMENGLKYGGDTVHVTAVASDGVVRVVVEDDGPGIPEDLIEDVFDEFVQVGRPAERVASGFGLGLPIARRLVQAMGGRIWAERSDMGGAAFVVEMPVAQLQSDVTL